MQNRTFFRIMINNLFLNNPFCKAIVSFVNFCNEQDYFAQKKLKFLKKMPLTKIEPVTPYTKKFLFDPNKISGANYK